MIISADKKGTIDGTAMRILEQVKTAIPLIPINVFSDYEFNPELLKLDKWILFDFLEMGANEVEWMFDESLLWGYNAHKFRKAQTDEWKKFDAFVSGKPPLMVFKREVLFTDLNKTNYPIYPIEFPAFYATPPIQSKEEFDVRPIQVMFNWGFSNEARKYLHGNIFVHSVNASIEVVDKFQDIDQTLKEKNNKSRVWATIFSPHWNRADMQVVYYYQGMSKLSVSLWGAGCRCFRHAEASINSIMVMNDDDLASSINWEHGVNCIKIPKPKTVAEARGIENQWKVIETIEEALKRDDLYEIYKNGVATCDKYRIDNYMNNYIQKIINGL